VGRRGKATGNRHAGRNDDTSTRGDVVRPLNAPFAKLGASYAATKASTPRPAPESNRRPAASGPRVEVARSAAAGDSNSTAPADPPRVDDASLFADAMQGVVRLGTADHDRHVDQAPPKLTPRAQASEEAEALAALSDLVTGAARFDVTDTHEYFEGIVAGLDRRLVRRLRLGEFACQAHIDLHGMTTVAARAAVDRFLDTSIAAGHRCVLIVHGRGLNSKDGTPVLKEGLKTWLSHGRLSRRVLAFATARPCDGGAGALYVLLRRSGRRRPFHVNEGSADL
jgi:DNA-nicking Smr family endonuclease